MWNGVSLNVQVAEVKKPLGSVYRMTKEGNKIVFEDGNNYILNKRTGRIIGLEERNGAYVFNLWVPAAKRKEDSPVKISNRFNALSEVESSIFPWQDEFF